MQKFPKENGTQFNRKFMLTIVWNLRGFHLIKVLEKDRTFNASYYIAKILESLSQWLSIEAAGNERKLLVHANNARRDTAKLSTPYFNENRMKSAPHPPYSHDLAPSDFCHSGMPKDVSHASHSRMQISLLQQSKVFERVLEK
jgi:hypothetical protein